MPQSISGTEWYRGGGGGGGGGGDQILGGRGGVGNAACATETPAKMDSNISNAGFMWSAPLFVTHTVARGATSVHATLQGESGNERCSPNATIIC